MRMRMLLLMLMLVLLNLLLHVLSAASSGRRRAQRRIARKTDSLRSRRRGWQQRSRQTGSCGNRKRVHRTATSVACARSHASFAPSAALLVTSSGRHSIAATTTLATVRASTAFSARVGR